MDYVSGTIHLDKDTRDFLVYRSGSGKNSIEIYDIQVGSDRRKGRGRALVNTLLTHYTPRDVNLIYAITRSSNLIAQEFYEGLGFRVVGVLRNFYKDEFSKDCADAIMYGRDV